MQTPAQRLHTAYLTRFAERLAYLRTLDLSQAAARDRARAESLALIRAVSRYRGLIKNVAEAVA